MLEDVDECNMNTHECSSNGYCNNTVGGYECFCHMGFSGNGFECSGIALNFVIIIYWLIIFFMKTSTSVELEQYVLIILTATIPLVDILVTAILDIFKTVLFVKVI